MQLKKYLYSFSYDYTESELSKLESRYLFGEEDSDKQLFSNTKIEPSSSAFIKSRLDVITYSEDYDKLITDIKNEKIRIEDFKVEYLVFEGDTTAYQDRLGKLKDIGYSIEGTPDYYNPTTTYALCYYQEVWCFGILIKNKFGWHKHKKKPRSYSNSININIAKALVNLAAKGDKQKKLLDACCGVGTIMLEACFSGYNIEGCDINWKVCRDTRVNLEHFNYTANVYRSDIKDIDKRYDAAIIDLPYDLFSFASENDIVHIIESAALIVDRLVIVSISDVTDVINNTGFRIKDNCSVGKRANINFVRKVWVCEKKIA